MVYPTYHTHIRYHDTDTVDYATNIIKIKKLFSSSDIG